MIVDECPVNHDRPVSVRDRVLSMSAKFFSKEKKRKESNSNTCT